MLAGGINVGALTFRNLLFIVALIWAGVLDVTRLMGLSNFSISLLICYLFHVWLLIMLFGAF